MKTALKSRHAVLKSPVQNKETLSDLTIKNAVLAAISAAIDQKALDIRGLNINSISSIADYFVLASGTSRRHVQGIADKITQALSAIGFEPNYSSGYETAEWLLLDYGDFVIHIFYEPTRQYYEFDSLWQNGRNIDLPENLALQARRLRTRI